MCLWSHAGGEPQHLHFVVQPVRSADLDGHRRFGPALQMRMFDAGRLPAAEAVADFADRMRAHLAAEG